MNTIEQREIKFRAWNFEVEKMMFLNIVHKHTIMTNLSIPSMGTWEKLSGFMQYTGLKDKNGVEIYEGDIYEYETWHGGAEHALADHERIKKGLPPIDYTERRVVLGHPNGHYITRYLNEIEDMTYTGDVLHHSPVTAKNWTVIGNIFTHPHLLQS